MEVRRIPSTALSQSQSMQLDLERVISRFPQVAFVFSRTGTPDLAADPMPPNASDTYIILKPQEEWPDPDLSKEELIRQIGAEAGKLPGNKFGFSQPIQMRFNELIAGVRDDVAIKVFGDEFEPMLQAANQIAGILRRPRRCGRRQGRGGRRSAVPGNQDRQGRNRAPGLEPRRRAGRDRHRRSAAMTAGLVFEGDRRFQIIVRLADSAARRHRDA